LLRQVQKGSAQTDEAYRCVPANWIVNTRRNHLWQMPRDLCEVPYGVCVFEDYNEVALQSATPTQVKLYVLPIQNGTTAKALVRT
jgi:hypothetical protein